MERLVLVALLLGGCGSAPPPPPPGDPLVGHWSGMLAPAPAMDSQSEDWVFAADKTAIRTNVIHYNNMIPSQTGCVETITYSFTSYVEMGTMIIITGGSGTDDQAGCVTAGMNHVGMPLSTGLALSGSYAISGPTLTMTLNGDTETYARQ